MSRPQEVLEDCEDPNCVDCKHGYGVFKGEYANLVPCQRNRCMAWRVVGTDYETGAPVYDCILLRSKG
jgi:hypothetical protein